MLSLKTQPTTIKFTNDELESLVNEAFNAAVTAEDVYRAQYGEPEYPCGFGWVTIRPGGSQVARYLKKIGAAKSAYDGGVSVWNPGGSRTQNMYIKEEGSRAFAKVLRSRGVLATACSRLD